MIWQHHYSLQEKEDNNLKKKMYIFGHFNFYVMATCCHFNIDDMAPKLFFTIQGRAQKYYPLQF